MGMCAISSYYKGCASVWYFMTCQHWCSHVRPQNKWNLVPPQTFQTADRVAQAEQEVIARGCAGVPVSRASCAPKWCHCAPR